MANKKLFKSAGSTSKNLIVNTVNKAGGVAYDLGAEGALAQYVVTGCLSGTYYANADEQVDKVLELAAKCDNKFIAQAAVYGHRVAHMKDTPALLANVLANRGEEGLRYLNEVFPRVISGTKMLRNFVQILRSGKVGRKSFGSAVKRMVNDWLASQESEALFKQSVGNDPSLADIVKMLHPKPEKKEKEAFYAWLLGKEYNKRYLPKLVKQFEAFKAGEGEAPDVDFRMLSNHMDKLEAEGWKNFARNGGWNFLRMNLNNLQKYGCFDDSSFVKEVADKLRDADLVRKANAFPYQLLTSYQNTTSIPMPVKLALQDALEIATANVPELAGETTVCVDTSGSMSCPVTGNRGLGATTVTRCVDVASLIAACVLRKNPSAIVVPFDTSVHLVSGLNPRDSVLTNAQKFARNGGGTDCASALRYLNDSKWKGKNVIFVSDNESWSRGAANTYYGRGRTDMMEEWNRLVARNHGAKLVCIDLVPGSTTQVPDNKNVLNVGGFSDSVFEVVANFVNNDSRDFAQVIRDKISLTGTEE